MSSIKFLVKSNDNMKPKPLLLIAITIVMLGISPFLPAYILFFCFYIGLIIFTLVKLTIKTNYLYISIVLFVLCEFTDKIFFSLTGTTNLDMLLGILLYIGILINLIILIAGIYRAIKMKDYVPNIVFIITNILIVGLLIIFSKVINYRYSQVDGGIFEFAESYLLYIFATYILLVITILFAKKITYKYKKINLFK